MRNINIELEKPPKVVSASATSSNYFFLSLFFNFIFQGDLPKIMPPAKIQVVQPSHSDWSISNDDRIKYEQLFFSLQPIDGFLAGNKVKGVLMDSKLPFDILSRIWDLADQDKDGNLNKPEFLIVCFNS